MKIALQWGAPEQRELAQFLQAVGCETQQRPIPEEDLWRQPDVIAAFDGGRLIGIGAAYPSGPEASSGYRIVIDPAYESRGIRQPMIKLLQAAKPKAQTAALYA